MTPGSSSSTSATTRSAPRRTVVARERQYQHDHTRAWSEEDRVIRRLRDGHARVQPQHLRCTQERNRLPVHEWNNKAVGFVSYGGVGGARAAEHLRLVCGELMMADVRQQVALSLVTEWERFERFRPRDHNVAALHTLLDQVVAWSTALAPLARRSLSHSPRRSPHEERRGGLTLHAGLARLVSCLPMPPRPGLHSPMSRGPRPVTPCTHTHNCSGSSQPGWPRRSRSSSTPRCD